MIITQTPFRMSFFGGGTDMESFFRENGGAVLSTTFDKYCYVNVRHLPRFFDYSTELSYSKTERVTCIEDIQHPAIRNAMKMLDIKKDKNGKIEEEGIYGKWYSSDELYVEVIKDKAFYGNCESPSSDGVTVLDSLPGGVTFSGGECMLQMKELKPLLERLNTEGVHTAVETSLFASICDYRFAKSSSIDNAKTLCATWMDGQTVWRQV